MEYRHASVNFGILSLGRSLNFAYFRTPLPPRAGLSAGLAMSGVSGIDGRDSDGDPTGLLKTTESQAFLGFGIRFTDSFSAGINLKLFYYHLYTDITSFTVGIDGGCVYRATGQLTVSAVVRDINSKYKWDTSKLFGTLGQSYEDRFPALYIVGVSYHWDDPSLLLSVEGEASDRQSLVARAGAEWSPIQQLTIRAGIDRIDLREKGQGIRPGFGFSVRQPYGSLVPALHYAYVAEPFAPSGIHMISLSVLF
jgi:hypothetical protein